MNININTAELLSILDHTPASHNIMLCGAHGIGKSRIIEDFFSKKGMKVVTLFLGQMSDPGDLIGLPHKDEATGHTVFLPPFWFPTDASPIVLFLDELNRARPELLQTVMDLSLNRRLAGRSLPEGSRIISAINLGEQYQLTELDPALVSRFNIYNFTPTPQEWLVWASKSGIDSRIITFLEGNPTYLDRSTLPSADPMDKTPDRRAWERVSQLLATFTSVDNVLKKTIAGVIGAEVANKFFAHIASNKSIDGKDILTDFGKCKPILSKAKLPVLATVNDSFFRCLEVADTEGANSAAIRFNALEYVEWVFDSAGNELAAHFAKNFTSDTYPNACSYLLVNDRKLMDRLSDYIQRM